MRTVGLAYMGIFVVGLTAFLQAGARTPEPGAPAGARVAAPTQSPPASVAGAPVDAAAAAFADGAASAPRARALLRSHAYEAAAPVPAEQPSAPVAAGEASGPVAAARASEPVAAPEASSVDEPSRIAPAAPTPPAARAARDDDDDRDRWRRRSRNRYPGPIPTPADWEAPEGPVRIALQAGHWRAHEAPSELSGLRDNGTAWEKTREWEANLAIAESAGAMLEELGYEVDILPAVVPPGYRAHLFIAIHADGSNDPNASGYRVASPRRDATGRAATIAALLEESYGEATGIRRLPTVTRRMQNYYAFNFRRYEHALHPMTIGVILETGFLTSARDREVILSDPDRAARGIVQAVRAFEITPAPMSVATGGELGGR